MKKLALTLAAVLTATAVSGCGVPAPSDLTIGYTPNPIADAPITDVSNAAVTDFAVRLFKNSFDAEKNTLISPLSVLAALSMTANGAVGDTLSQMESALGMPTEQLNGFIHHYMQNLPTSEKYKLSMANSIWFTDKETFTVNEDFLQTNADYYGAGIYRAPFDATTCKQINDWVKENTDGMIKEILDKIPSDAVMYLVNALAFDAEWQRIYKENEIRDGEFTRENGTKRKVEMMHSSESSYLEDENAVGFIKYYADRKYAFAALLPDEDLTLADYIETLDGEALHAMLSSPEITSVRAAIPKFEVEYDVEMSDILKAMGMENAFIGTNADFSKLGHSTEGNIAISRVLHKTYISVDEKGTKAGAATAVEMNTESAAEPPRDPKIVHLDRPFVYMLIDCESMMPFFIGTITDI